MNNLDIILLVDIIIKESGSCDTVSGKLRYLELINKVKALPIGPLPKSELTLDEILNELENS